MSLCTVYIFFTSNSGEDRTNPPTEILSLYYMYIWPAISDNKKYIDLRHRHQCQTHREDPCQMTTRLLMELYFPIDF